MIESYLNQKLTYWKTSTNGFGDTVIDAGPITIDCRFQEKQKLIKDDEGQEVVSEAEIWSMVNLKGTEVVKGESAASEPTSDARAVLTTAERVDLDGENDGFKAWL